MTTPTQAPSRGDEAAAFLAQRMRHRNDFPVRCSGISSDALALYGVGQGERPTVPGRPEQPGGSSWRGDECGRSYPADEADLLACTVTYLMAPRWAQERMRPVLAEFERYVWHGINRYGEKVLRGYRDDE